MAITRKCGAEPIADGQPLNDNLSCSCIQVPVGLGLERLGIPGIAGRKAAQISAASEDATSRDSLDTARAHESAGSLQVKNSPELSTS